MLVIANNEDLALMEQFQSGANMRPNFKGSLPAAINAANDMSVNATLRKDEWEVIDERVNEEARNRLTVMDAFRSRGLVQSLGVGDIERVTERLDAFSEASVTYDGANQPEEDRANYSEDRRAVPIVSHAFRIGFRQLASSNRRGNNLQTDNAGLAARAVSHRMQGIITNGFGHQPSGGALPGLTTAANRIQISLDVAWNLSGGDPIGDVVRMLEGAYDNFLFGPFVLMVPKNYWAFLQEDYKASGDGTPMDRTYLERIEAFEDIDSVMPNDALADDEVLLVQMTRDAMDISEALSITTWQWEKTPAVTHYRVLMIAGPHIKSIQTQDGTTVNGIVHLS